MNMRTTAKQFMELQREKYNFAINYLKKRRVSEIMGRRKGSGNRNGKKPWEEYGIAESTYYLKLRKGLIPDRDRKETESIFLSEKKFIIKKNKR